VCSVVVGGGGGFVVVVVVFFAAAAGFVDDGAFAPVDEAAEAAGVRGFATGIFTTRQ
jgi:hypothetical protein